MLYKVFKRIQSNFGIYKQDLKTKGIYYSIIDRINKFGILKFFFAPFFNIFKPDFVFVENHKVFIDKNDSTISPELLYGNKWEEFEFDIFKKNIKKGDVVLDIGAHIGLYTLAAAKLVGNQGKVYAFEPNDTNFKLLKKNIEQNGYKNVFLVKKAVSDTNGQANLYLNKDNTGDHRIFNSEQVRIKVPIELITLDSFFKKKDKRVDFIKMDIQGAEVRALKGGEALIKHNPLIKILSEFWPKGIKFAGSSNEEYLSILFKNHFRIFNIDEGKKKLVESRNQKILNFTMYQGKDYTNIFCKR